MDTVRVDELRGVVHSEIKDLSLRVEFGVRESFAYVLGARFVVLDSGTYFKLGVGSLSPLVARRLDQDIERSLAAAHSRGG